MILKDYAVNIPFDLGGIVVKREKWVEMETERTYPEGKKGSRVKRVTIGQVVPLFPGRCIRTKTISAWWFPTAFRKRSGTFFYAGANGSGSWRS